MPAIYFQDRSGRVARSPYRTDVALFVGLVARRPGPPIRTGEPALHRWLVDEGWTRGDDPAIDALLDVPVPIDRFETFDRLFAWDRRPVGATADARLADTYLGAAVRSYFAQGGRLCYVVRVGAPGLVPITPEDSVAERALRGPRLEALITGATGGVMASPVERATWKGVWTLYGLPDVSFVALPDLPDLVQAPITIDAPLPIAPAGEVGFLECTEPGRSIDDGWLRQLHAPTCDDDGYATWARALRVLVDEVARPRPGGTLREVQVVATVPRPDDTLAVHDLLAYLSALDGGVPASAFLQLVYPWLVTERSRRLPGAVEPPDGGLVGVLARNALEHGCFRSIGGQPVPGVLAQLPALGGRDTRDAADRTTLGGRVTLIGPTPAGMQVLSDVTTSLEPTFRLAHANRAVAAIVRVLRTIGEDYAFGPSEPGVWSSVRARVRDVLREFWHAGALRGATEADAFDVRCDRSTMTANDLDSGRLVVVVELAVAVSIQRINVVLTRTGDSVTLERAA